MQVQDKNPRIFTAVCVQRSPVVTKMKSRLEVGYQKFQDQLELEHSALSEDEVQLEEFLQRKRKLKDDDDENMTIGIFEADRKVRCIVWPEVINIQTAKNLSVAQFHLTTVQLRDKRPKICVRNACAQFCLENEEPP